MPNRGYPKILLGALVALLACLMPASAVASDTQASGGAPYQPPPHKAKIVNGKAVAPKDAPRSVRKVIAAANKIVKKHYRYGGGHAKFNDSAYDCSGSVSYALHGAKLVKQPLDSTGFMHWARHGSGRWITVYANSGHAFMMVAGLRFDTGYRDKYGQQHGAARGSGPRWGKKRSTSGFVARHPKHL